MKNNGWISRLLTQPSAAARIDRAAGILAAAVVIAAAGQAIAQDNNPASPLPEQKMSVPEGYTLHHTIDMGGRISGQVGSGAMYDTLVNLQSGPRVQAESFELHAIPSVGRITLVDNLSAFSSGFGGDPNTFTKLNVNKGKAYEFSGIFRRDRQYMDYNLLGNPNIATGFSIPVGGSTPYAWQQFNDSTFLFNTVRRMTDTNLTVLPLSTVTYRFEYSQNTFEGPSLTPSGNAIAGQEIILQEFQRNSTDDFTAAVDWKPARNTKLTFEEQIDHYKNDSNFTLAPQFLTVQEANGTKAQLLASYTAGANSMPYGYNSAGNFVPYSTGTGATASSGACNASIVNPSQILSASPGGGLPIIDPACNVLTSYIRTAPTRVIFPTEMFRLQSTIKNISMNGNARYTNGNMNLANYYDAFQGLQGATRQMSFAGYANAKRQVMAADYGLVWQLASKFSLAEQVSFSNAHQPGIAGMLSETTVSVPTTKGLETVNNMPNAPVNVTSGSPVTGGPALGGTQAGYFGQKFATNLFTLSWDATPRTTFSLSWRYQNHLISEGQGSGPGTAHNVPIPANNTTSGEVTINENGGIFNAALRPTANWDLNGSFEAAYNDSVFTPMGFRQLRHYRIHTMYRVKPWATVSGAFNDLERHNNTNNNQSIAGNTTPYFGQLNRVDHARVVSLGTELTPNDHYGLDLSYSYNDVYTSENICFQGAASPMPGGAVAPGASTQSGVICGGVTAGHGANNVLFLDRQFADAPTEFGSAALALSPNTKLRYNFGYRVSAVNGSRSFSDARDVNGSIVSTYQTPFISAAWTIHPGFIWKGEYNYYGYGEGGRSGAQYCNANPNLAIGTASAPGVLCSSLPYTAINGPASGAAAPRNFHANNVTLGFHYEF